MLLKVLSGGQTGADRAALDAGMNLQFPIGGYCPSGREAEDGLIDLKYGLVEVDGGYRSRTKRNVEEADGTVIFYQSHLQGGTEQTVTFCMKAKKPYKLIDIETVSIIGAVKIVQRFVDEYQIDIMNVAGPRETRCPGIYDYVLDVIMKVILESKSGP